MSNNSIFDWKFVAKKLALCILLGMGMGLWENDSMIIILSHYNPHGLAISRGPYTIWDLVVCVTLDASLIGIVGAWMAFRCWQAKRNIGAFRYAVYFLGSSLSVIALATLYSVAVGNWGLFLDAPFVMLLWGIILVEIMIRKRPLE